MKTYLECYPCLLNQALRAARLSRADVTQQHAILQHTLSLLQNIPLDANPAELANQVHLKLREMLSLSGCTQDAFREVKQASTRQALALYPKLKALVQQSADPLDLAIRISIAGNIIDFAVSDQIANLWETVERVSHQSYAIDDTARLKAHLKTVDSVLYLADNAGETVFDRVLIEVLPVSVVYAVKGGPIVNDATLPDAIAAGLDTCATLIDNGSQAVGTVLSSCSETFRAQFDQASLVIAKGQANFETLGDSGAKVFCLLQVKCPMIGLDLDALVGSIVARQSRARSTETGAEKPGQLMQNLAQK